MYGEKLQQNDFNISKKQSKSESVLRNCQESNYFKHTDL